MIPYINLTKLNAPYLPAFQAGLQKFVGDNQFVLGPAVEQFEAAYAQFIGTKHCIGVANATQGLELILTALDIGLADEVIAPAYTCDATWVAIHNTGAQVVPVDVDLSTRNLNPALLEAAISPRTRAVVVVHMAGLPADVEPILNFCERHGLHLIEDNAQATGAIHQGRHTGSFGIAAAHSFYPTKTLGALGDGGAVTTNNAALAAKLKQARAYGRNATGDVAPGGQNARLDELQAHFLLAKLPNIEKHIAKSNGNATLYTDLLSNLPGLHLPNAAKGSQPAWHLYSILTAQRDDLRKFLLEFGIETALHYPGYLPTMPVFNTQGHYPIAKQIAAQTLSLPLSTATITEVGHICLSIHSYFKQL